MKLQPLALVIVVTVLAMIGVSAWAWGQVPDGAQIPIHWGLDGKPNGYGPKWLALLLMPALGLVLGAVFLMIPRFDPRRDHLVASTRAWIWITGAAMVMLLVVQVGTVAAVLGAAIDMGKWIGVGMGALFVVIGNFLGKTRSNWFVGIRTPWTMSSERSWTLTHRLGGRLFVLIGLLSVVLGLTANAEIVFWAIFPGLGVAVIAMVVYSYIVWRDDPERRAV